MFRWKTSWRGKVWRLWDVTLMSTTWFSWPYRERDIPDLCQHGINTEVLSAGILPGVYDLVNYLDTMAQYGPVSESTLLWRHYRRDNVSNHQPHDCLLNRLFGLISKKTSKLHVTGLCAGNSPGIGEFPAQMASNAENVSIWWRLHEVLTTHVLGCLLIQEYAIKHGNAFRITGLLWWSPVDFPLRDCNTELWCVIC